MSPFKLAFTHLWRKKISSLIALLSIAISVATSGVLLRTFMLSKSRFSTLAQTGDAIVGAKSSDISLLLGCLNLEGEYPDFVPGVLYQSLASKQAVHFEDGLTTDSSPIETVIPFVVFAKKEQFRILGTNELFVQSRYPTLPHLQEGRWATGANEVVLGAKMAEKLGAKIDQSINVQSWVDKKSQWTQSLALKVVGILAPTEKSWDRAGYSNLEMAQKVFEFHAYDLKSIWKSNLLHYYLIYMRPENFNSAGSGMRWLKNLINQRTVAQTVAVDEVFKSLEELTGTQQELGFFISMIIIFLGALCATTMMITRFESMGQQLAVLRALGFSRSELRQFLVSEALMLNLTACVLGALLDAAIFPWVRELLGTSLPSSDIVAMPIWQSLPVWITAFIGGLLSILIPLWRMYRQNIHISLRNIS